MLEATHLLYRTCMRMGTHPKGGYELMGENIMGGSFFINLNMG